jgi:hypothetical protein
VHDGPVFVAGLADSGKTPLTRLLTDRTSILVTRHTRLWYRFGSRSEDRSGGLGTPEQLEHALDTLLGDPAVAWLQTDPQRLRRSLAGHRPTLTDVFAGVHAQYAERHGRNRWGEQCGALETYADRLLQELPTARVIHLIRDPAAAYAIAARRHGANAVRRAWFMARWLRSVQRAQRHTQRFPDRYLLVSYETLAAHTDPTMRAICAFLDEPVGDEPFTWGGAPTGSIDHAGHHGTGGKYAPPATVAGVDGSQPVPLLVGPAARAVRVVRAGRRRRPLGPGHPAPTVRSTSQGG